MAFPVLATKLFRPARRPDAVARARLTSRLDTTLEDGHRLALVSAPPGFGKSTVLTEWIGSLEARDVDVDVAWLSLDERDNDVARFATHLVAALQGIGLGSRTGPPESTVGAEWVTGLVNEIATSQREEEGRHRILVLDDYHAITAAPVHEMTSFLVDNMPDRLRLVVATRSDPPLPLSRLRARGQLTELRAADLRFTGVEAQELLNGPMGLSLSSTDAAALESRTEGWAAGLQLAALSLRGADKADVAGFVHDFAGSDRFVIDYLADEVLARQPAVVRDFLLATAVLDRLSGPLCDAVTGRDDGAATLTELERANLFVVPLDRERVWYRYHHLFADVLLARLLADQADRVPALHRAASDWFLAQGQPVDAVRHALAGQDLARAAYLMESALAEVSRARQDAVLLGWIRDFPAGLVRRSPTLSITAAWSRLMAGDLGGAEARLGDAEAALAAGESDAALRATWADTADLRTAPAVIEVYRASLAQARGDVAGTVAHAQRAVDAAGPEDHFVRGAGGGFLGLAAWAAGDVRRALETFGEAVGHLHAAGNLVDELDSTVVLADMWVAAGRPSRARRLYEDALRTATSGGEPYPRATADLHVGLADLDREAGDLTAAEEHLGAARRLAERGSISENRHRLPVVTAALHLAEGEHDEALTLLDQAHAAYRPGFYPDVRPIPSVRARAQIAAGDLEAAAAWAEGLSLGDDPGYLAEHALLSVARMRIARALAGIDTAEGVTTLLDRLLEQAQDAGRDGSVREIRLVQALAHHAAGELGAALEALALSLEAPEPEQHVRLYLDEGQPMVDLLHSAMRDHAHPTLRSHAERLLGGATQPQPRTSLPDPLSERELQVLRLLESELTGPAIARELYVSLNTLRTHTKHIFTKLDVTTRAAAVRRGRELGVL